MTTRAKLQELGLDDLRHMAGQVEVEHDGLQKTKLIAAILDSDKFDAAMVPDVAETSRNGEQEAQGQSSGDGQPRSEGEGYGDRQGRRRRRNRGGTRPDFQQADESELEVREGILDILPEGYGFLRCSGYLPGDRDVYVAAN
ncbi:MAG: hypothetical protein M3349_05940, partial [Actinomycetota bacterium]|nr:hypothetical protein [Actinomycetota bacterium]